MKNLSLIIVLLAILMSCNSVENDSKTELGTLIFEENKQEITALTHKYYANGMPPHGLVIKTNLKYLDTLNRQISKGDFQAALNYIQSFKPKSKIELKEVIKAIEGVKDISIVLFQINKSINKLENQLFGKYHLIEELIPIAITDKTEYSRSDSVHISIYAHGKYEMIVPLVKLKFTEKKRKIKLSDHDENHAYHFSLAASDIRSDTIKGVFFTPDPLGGDIKKNFNIPILIK